jgi:hypothetical protein
LGTELGGRFTWRNRSVGGEGVCETAVVGDVDIVKDEGGEERLD